MKYKRMFALLVCIAAHGMETQIDVISISNNNKNASKFGEYSGLNDTFIDGNILLKSDDLSMILKGTDLGTTSRSVNAQFGEQGKYQLTAGFDQLFHSVSTNYQTPFVGVQGSNSFTLPSNFGTLNGATGAVGGRSLSANQLSMFHDEKVGTTRKNTSFGARYTVNNQFNMQFDYNHLQQSGAKLVAASSQGGINTPTGTATTDQWKAESIAIIMNPTQYKNDTFDFSFNWLGEKGRLSATYFGSIFKDEFNQVSWENNLTNTAAGMCATANCQYEYNSMSTAPSNTYHQVGLNGMYQLGFDTKLTSGATYGIGKQNDTYLSGDLPQTANGGAATTVPTMQANGLPATSLDGKIIQTHGDMKLVNSSIDHLQIVAAYKYNRRENKSPSKYYLYYNLGGTAVGKQYTGINNPYSNYKSETELAFDYRLTSAQKIKFTYETEKYKRWCDDAAHKMECVGSTGSFENKLKLDYRIKATDDLNVNMGYAYGRRTVEDVLHYMTPIGSEATIQATQMDGKDVIGFVSLPFAARIENQFKAGMTWQVSELFDVGLNGNYTLDKFDSAIGVQKMDNGMASIDATLTINDKNIISTYASYQAGNRNMHIANDGTTVTLPTKFWDNQLKDDSKSVGVVSRHNKLFGSALDVVGDLSYSIDQTKYATQVPYDITCSAQTNLSCGNLPTIKDSRLTFKLTNHYHLSKNSQVSLAYIYEKRAVDDYFYNGYQYGMTPVRIMPTNEIAPSYNIHFVSVSYAYAF